MRGTVRKISLPRRLIADLMHASAGIPFVSLRRTLDIAPSLEARALAVEPPGWAAIFVKAFGLVAKDEPVLRTLYAKWPWPHFYELPRSVAMVAIARRRRRRGLRAAAKNRPRGRQGIARRNRPADPACQDRTGRTRYRHFARCCGAAALPLPLRRLVWLIGLNFARQRANYFGSVAVTSVAAYGGGELHALSPGRSSSATALSDPTGPSTS